MKQTVLVTGASGFVARPMIKALRDAGHRVVCLDRRVPDNPQDFVHGDIATLGVPYAASDGCDVIIHLAACPNPADFDTVLVPPNVVGLYNVLDAARARGINKLILASSIQVGGPGIDGVIQPATMPGKPWNDYALTKAWAEQAGEMFARLHGMNVLAARIGWFPRNAKALEWMARDPNGPPQYLSHDDAGRFALAAVENPWTGFHLLYALSKPAPGTEAHWDRAAARDAVGYDPQDVFPNGSAW